MRMRQRLQALGRIGKRRQGCQSGLLGFDRHGFRLHLKYIGYSRYVNTLFLANYLSKSHNGRPWADTPSLAVNFAHHDV
jgi:hypothetical protein